MTEAIYLEVTEKTEAAKKAGRQVSVSGMLKFLGVSRSGYLAWLHHVPSDTEKRREAVKAKIQDIYDDSKQNYGAPKITVELRKTGAVISDFLLGKRNRRVISISCICTQRNSLISTGIIRLCGKRCTASCSSGRIKELTASAWM